MKYNIIVFGSGSVGKSALTVQYVQNFFVQHYDPTIEETYQKIVEVDGNQYYLDIVDTCGTESFSGIRDLYMTSGDGFLLVYSLISPQTLEELVETKTQIHLTKETADVPIVLVGNKADLLDQRKVTSTQGEEMAKKIRCPYLECSAKTGMNVEKAFTTLIQEINKRKSTGEKKKRIRSQKCPIL
jgi:small GTP-binding protein